MKFLFCSVDFPNPGISMSDKPAPTATPRDRRGRYVKGVSGNPAGRPVGILNEATRAAAVLLNGEAGALTRKAIDLALAGDIAALRLCLDRIIAPQREQPVVFAMPQIGDAAGPGGVIAAVAAAVSEGAITTSQAAELSQVVEASTRVAEAEDRAEARRVAVEAPAVHYRFDLRAAVVLANAAREVLAECGRFGAELDAICEPTLRFGQEAADALASMSDTLELLVADTEFLRAHPLPLDRELHPLLAAVHRSGNRLSDYLERNRARLERLAESEAAAHPRAAGTDFNQYGKST
jgi:hypothetical protein